MTEWFKALLNKSIKEVKDKYPLKAFGYFIAPVESSNPSDFIIIKDDVRNEMRDEFEDYGNYYKRNSDAGFLSTDDEIVRIHRRLVKENKTIIGVFHSHQRHPAIFSTVDIDFHPSENLWHLIISLRNLEYPQLKIFGIKNKEVYEIAFAIKGDNL
jgi:proteasome lid subunit RPN8/RPN11